MLTATATVVLVVAIANATVLLNAIVRSRLQRGGHDQRADYPNYRGVAWVARHFDEARELQTEYRSFVGWRRNPYQGTTINIALPYGFRRSTGEALDGSAYFLGGSTVWGTGDDDASTIPSLFHDAASMPVLNLGEAGYTSRQSLDTLLNVMSYGHTPGAVVSYEGVNDVRVGCERRIARLPADYYENQFRSELLPRSRPARAWRLVREFLMFVPERVQAKISPPRSMAADFDCHENDAKSRRVAQNLVDNWKFMNTVAAARDASFYAVLQPTVFSAESDATHLPRNEFDLRPEYDAVYPLVRRFAQEECSQGACGTFVDLSAMAFASEHVYIDFCHLSPNGNRSVAIMLSRIVRKMRSPHFRDSRHFPEAP